MPNEANTYVQHQLAFARFIQKEAQAVNEDARYALGNKFVDVPITNSLIEKFVQERNRELLAQPGTHELLSIGRGDGAALDLAMDIGLISETGMAAGVIECRITHPPYSAATAAVANTASTVPLQLEMESQVSLMLNATYKVALEKNPNYTEGQKIELKEKLDGVKQACLQHVNREILLDQIKWLCEKNGVPIENFAEVLSSSSNQELANIANEQFKDYVNKVGPEHAYPEFNQYLDGKRSEMAKEFRAQAFLAANEQGLLNTPGGAITRASVQEQLPKTPASTSDRLIQNGATGDLTLRSGTENTAHDKQLGERNLALVRILLNDGSVLWRVPSIAPADVKLAEGEKFSVENNRLVEDTQAKLSHIATTIQSKSNGGDPTDHVYYNLLTASGGNYSDNKQTASAEIILEAAHRINQQKLGEYNDKARDARQTASPPSFVLVNNLSVNQFANPSPEIKAMSDLAMLQLLAKQLPEDASVQKAAKEAMDGYKAFLSERKPGEEYAKSPFYKEQQQAIADLRAAAPQTVVGPEVKPTPQIKAAEVLLKMFKNGDHGNSEYGMLVQALLMVAEHNKVAGCKSACERFASVADKAAACISDPDFMKVMDEYLAGNIDEDKLYLELVDIYNRKNVYEGVGVDISCSDQGMSAKAEKFLLSAVSKMKEMLVQAAGAAKSVFSWNTNWFEHPNVTNQSQENAGKNQAHKINIAPAFDAAKDFRLNVAKGLNEMRADLEKYQQGKDQQIGQHNELPRTVAAPLNQGGIRGFIEKMRGSSSEQMVVSASSKERDLTSAQTKAVSREQRAEEAGNIISALDSQMKIINNPQSTSAQVSDALKVLRETAEKTKEGLKQEGITESNSTLPKQCDKLIEFCDKHERLLKPAVAIVAAQQQKAEQQGNEQNVVNRTRSSSNK